MENDLWGLSDEIYSEFVYDEVQQFHSIAEVPGMQERTIILDGFSKFFAITGWLLGYSIANPTINAAMADWATNFISCAPLCSTCWDRRITRDKATSNKMIKTFKERRDLICQLLNEIPGISVIKPRGGFQLGSGNVTKACRNLGLKDALAFQEFILSKANVAISAREFLGLAIHGTSRICPLFILCFD